MNTLNGLHLTVNGAAFLCINHALELVEMLNWETSYRAAIFALKIINEFRCKDQSIKRQFGNELKRLRKE